MRKDVYIIYNMCIIHSIKQIFTFLCAFYFAVGACECVCVCVFVFEITAGCGDAPRARFRHSAQLLPPATQATRREGALLCH